MDPSNGIPGSQPTDSLDLFADCPERDALCRRDCLQCPRQVCTLTRPSLVMTALQSFPAGRLPVRRGDGSETNVWLGPATIGHAVRQQKSWTPGLNAMAALDATWDWRVEVELMLRAPRRQLVLAVCQRDTGGRVHAMMNIVVLPRASRLVSGRDLLYIDMLSVAPWNRPGRPVREVKGLGPLLIQSAILVSRDAGLGGAFGLHSLPDPGTLKFYANVMGVSPVSIEPTPEGKLVYFEAPAMRAEQMLERDAAR